MTSFNPVQAGLKAGGILTPKQLSNYSSFKTIVCTINYSSFGTIV